MTTRGSKFKGKRSASVLIFGVEVRFQFFFSFFFFFVWTNFLMEFFTFSLSFSSQEAQSVLKEAKAVAAKKRRGSQRLENLGIPEEGASFSFCTLSKLFLYWFGKNKTIWLPAA